MKLNYQTQRISNDFWMKLDESTPKRVLSDTLKKRIDEIWDEEIRLYGSDRFNGEILNLIDCNDKGLVGHFIEYKWFVAARKDQEIQKALQLTPIGVSGIIREGNLALTGLRSKNLAAYPGLWELVPSGGISPKYVQGNTINYRQQMLDELEEETGVNREKVRAVTPFMLILDKVRSVLDICMELEMNSHDFHSEFSKGEYTEFKWITINQQLASESQWVPASIAILKEISG